jgi:hypothetical protein
MVGQCLNDDCLKIKISLDTLPFTVPLFSFSALFLNLIFEYGGNRFSHKIYIIFLKNNESL